MIGEHLQQVQLTAISFRCCIDEVRPCPSRKAVRDISSYSLHVIIHRHCNICKIRESLANTTRKMIDSCQQSRSCQSDEMCRASGCVRCQAVNELNDDMVIFE